MKHTARAIGLTAALLVLSSPIVSAQRIDSPYRFIDTRQYLGVYGGHLDAAEGRLGMGPQSAPIFGVNWSIRLSNAFSLGAEVAYSPSTRTVRDTTFDAADSIFDPLGDADLTLLIGLASLRLNLTGARTWNGLQPFLQFGGGLAFDIAGSSPLEADMPANARFDHGTSFAGLLGAGVEWFPASRVSLRLDGRNMLWKVRIPEAFLLTEAGRGLPRSEWEQNIVFAAGLSYHF